MVKGARSASPVPPDPPATEMRVSHAALVEYLASRAVTELVALEVKPRQYRLEAALSWRSGRSVLTGARGDTRIFRSLDTLATFLRTVGSGNTIVRLQIMA